MRTSPLAREDTSALDSGWSTRAVIVGIETQLGSMADVGRESGVPSDEEVGASLDFVGCDAFSPFGVSENVGGPREEIVGVLWVYSDPHDGR